MGKIRTMLLVALAAMAAMAFAIPAVASADWSEEEGGPLEEEVAFGLNYGSISWEIASMINFTCEVEGEVALTPGDQGEMITQVIPSSCSAAGALAGCEFASPPDPVSWPLTAQSDDIIAKNVTWEWSLEKCAISKIGFKGDLTLTPDNPFAMSTLSISGTGTTLPGSSKSSVVRGDLEFDESGLGLYGLVG